MGSLRQDLGYYGKTRINGKPVTAGMNFTKAECDAFLTDEVQAAHYYLALAKRQGLYVVPIYGLMFNRL